MNATDLFLTDRETDTQRETTPYQRLANAYDAFTAWRTNPLARRITNLTKDHVWGRGIRPISKNGTVNKWLNKFWDHELNMMDERIPIWIDALTLEGELFPTWHTSPTDGMTYLRALTSTEVQDLRWKDSDYEQITEIGQQIPNSLEIKWWPSIATVTNPTQSAAWQYAVNRPLGVIRGEGDLAPALPWLAYYAQWLDGRVQRNNFVTNFYYEVEVTDAADVNDAKKRYARPPAKGTVVVHSAAEKHKVVQPSIGADDASQDGYALRMMIATGGNVPLHWLAEPGQGNSEATSNNMNDVSYRFYATRQAFIQRRIEHLSRIAYHRAAALGAVRHYNDPQITTSVSDISKDDNLKLAQAARDIAQTFATMLGHNLDQDERITRLIYKFAGEDLDAEDLKDIIARAKSRPTPTP